MGHRMFAIGEIRQTRPVAGPPQQDRLISRGGRDVLSARGECGNRNAAQASFQLE